ncbi:MAG: prephenate dehydrogenase [Candidatus Omnitrophica bacterium]|nr:prephenate dehydrogenase [Candidatus Omnitrophota bacterium]MBU4303400.1 prephenate dehydrogenase [Candidatus Omnitrophota bacterium]MBU4468786.1 prephenate dehydrogenase [Candidatus Omnitrophota bacterium]
MKMFNKAVIIGTGLIGGSIGLALRKQHLAGQVIGLSRQAKNARLAKKVGAIDQVGSSLEAVADADLVILATPVNTIIDLGLGIVKKIKKGCIVIDVGSTKERIVSKLSVLIPNFLGCHPLAGSEKKGIANLEDNIFKGSICIITPTIKTSRRTLNKVKLLWKKLGAKIVILSAKKHDQALAFTSHLPHAVAFSLMNSIPNSCLGLSSSGLSDTTRISGSDAGLWSEIFLSNRINLLADLSIFQAKLSALKFALESKNKRRLRKILLLARKKREKLG